MTKFRITAQARSDLKVIGQFTQRRWGRESRIEYLDRLINACNQLAANPSLGRHREELAPGIRTFAVARHLIIYQVEDFGHIAVIRVLHQSMDYENSL